MYVLVSPLDQRSADIRFFDADGVQIDKKSERKLENLFFREDFRRAAFYEMGSIEHAEPIAAYRERLLSTVDADAIRAARFRVLIDYDYSAASAILPDVLNELGVTTIPLNAGISEGPFHREVTDETALITKTVRADVGVKINATGESLILIDDDGVVLNSHEAFAVLARWRLAEGPGLIVAPATTPQWLVNMVESSGGAFAPTKSDPPSLLRAATGQDVRLASDGDGGFVWPRHLAAFDAMYTIVKLLELRALRDETLAYARQELPWTPYITTTEFCPWERKGRVMRVLLEEHRGRNIDLSDGIKVFVESGFVLVRPDPDAPAYHIVVSVSDEDAGRQLLEEYVSRVREAQGEHEAHAAELL